MKNKNAFNWDIKKTGILDINGNPIKGYNHITRDDNGSSIAVMKDSYNPMTTKQFTETAEEVAEKFGTTVKEYQDWDTGKKENMSNPLITAQMEISEPLSIGGSKIEGKLTLGVGFNGNRSFFIGHTNTYLRCTNEFHSIVKDFTSRLTKNNMVRVADIIQNIETYREYEAKLYENFKKFEKVPVSEGIISELMARLLKLNDEERMMTPKELEEHLSTQKLNKKDAIMASVRTEMAELGDNAWGLLNGVTHFTTHVMSGNEISGMFGAKKEANHIAYDLGLELLEA